MGWCLKVVALGTIFGLNVLLFLNMCCLKDMWLYDFYINKAALLLPQFVGIFIQLWHHYCPTFTEQEKLEKIPGKTHWSISVLTIFFPISSILDLSTTTPTDSSPKDPTVHRSHLYLRRKPVSYVNIYPTEYLPEHFAASNRLIWCVI